MDRGAFAFPQSGLFTAEQDHALVAIVMKGREMHGGWAHRLHACGEPGTLVSADGIRELFTDRPRVWRLGFICYPSMVAYRRTAPAYAFPPCMFGCTVRTPKAPSGLAPYIIGGGGGRIYRSRGDFVEHGVREVLMEAANKLADMGVDPSPLLSLTRFTDSRDGTHFACLLPSRRGEQEDLDALLWWHIRTSELFLLKVTPCKSLDPDPQSSESRVYTPDFRQLWERLVARIPPPIHRPHAPTRHISEILSVKMSQDHRVRHPSTHRVRSLMHPLTRIPSTPHGLQTAGRS